MFPFSGAYNSFLFHQSPPPSGSKSTQRRVPHGSDKLSGAGCSTSSTREQKVVVKQITQATKPAPSASMASPTTIDKGEAHERITKIIEKELLGVGSSGRVLSGRTKRLNRSGEKIRAIKIFNFIDPTTIARHEQIRSSLEEDGNPAELKGFLFYKSVNMGDNGMYCAIMSQINKGDVNSQVEAISKYPSKQKEQYLMSAAEQLFSSLALAHRHDIIVGDRKAANILIKTQPAPTTPPSEQNREVSRQERVQFKHADLDTAITKEEWTRKGGLCRGVNYTPAYSNFDFTQTLTEETQAINLSIDPDKVNNNWEILKQNDIYGTAMTLYQMFTGTLANQLPDETGQNGPLSAITHSDCAGSAKLEKLATCINQLLHLGGSSDDEEEILLTDASTLIKRDSKMKTAQDVVDLCQQIHAEAKETSSSSSSST